MEIVYRINEHINLDKDLKDNVKVFDNQIISPKIIDHSDWGFKKTIKNVRIKE